jgi:cell division protein ZapA
MGKITIEVNGKPYALGCADGEEARLLSFVREFDREVASLAKSLGQIGDARLFLMAGLLYTEELSEVRARLKASEFDHAAALAAHGADRARITALEARIAELSRDLETARHDRAAEAARADAAEEMTHERLKAAAARIDALVAAVESA